MGCLLAGGIGSCHSFGVAVGLRGYGMCQMCGASRSTIFLKMRRVGQCIYQLSHVLYFYKVQVVPKPFTCPRGKSLLVECHPLDDQIVRGPITANVCVYLVAGIGGFKNGAKRNVKTDPHRSCPPIPNEIKKRI